VVNYHKNILLFLTRNGGNVDYDKVCTECLKEMFKRVGEEYPNKLTKQKDWWMKRSWTLEEEIDFKEWMRKYLKKTCRWNAKMIDKEVGMFMLMWSWKINTEAL
jgi:hypothetical protein